MLLLAPFFFTQRTIEIQSPLCLCCVIHHCKFLHKRAYIVDEYFITAWHKITREVLRERIMQVIVEFSLGLANGSFKVISINYAYVVHHSVTLLLYQGIMCLDTGERGVINRGRVLIFCRFSCVRSVSLLQTYGIVTTHLPLYVKSKMRLNLTINIEESEHWG